MADGTGKTKIRELKLELYLDDELRAALLEVLEGEKETLEVNHLYFRHLVVEDFRHEGLKIDHLKIPVGRITKLRVRIAGN